MPWTLQNLKPKYKMPFMNRFYSSLISKKFILIGIGKFDPWPGPKSMVLGRKPSISPFSHFIEEKSIILVFVWALEVLFFLFLLAQNNVHSFNRRFYSKEPILSWWMFRVYVFLFLSNSFSFDGIEFKSRLIFNLSERICIKSGFWWDGIEWIYQ